MNNILNAEQIRDSRHFHVGTCTRTVGPKGGIKDDVITVRRYSDTKYGNGSNSDQFTITTKHGLYTYYYINNNNVADVHAWDDCPIGIPVNIKVKELVSTAVNLPTWDTDYFD